MGLLDFVKAAGEKLFHTGPAKTAAAEAAAEPANEAKIKAANDTAADAITAYIASQNLSATGMVVAFDGASATVTVYGVAPDQATMEKIVLCCGNVSGVAACSRGRAPPVSRSSDWTGALAAPRASPSNCPLRRPTAAVSVRCIGPNPPATLGRLPCISQRDSS